MGFNCTSKISMVVLLEPNVVARTCISSFLNSCNVRVRICIYMCMWINSHCAMRKCLLKFERFEIKNLEIEVKFQFFK